jgi:SAM-dependent methyltransferase
LREEFIFDKPHYERFNAAREASLLDVVPKLRETIGLSTVLDMGCGLGHFSGFLTGLGFSVVGADGRDSNVTEARRRFPSIEFRVADLQERSAQDLGTYDMVLCLGLLYHLENPMQAIRNLEAMTSKFLVVEGMCVPFHRPSLYLLQEGSGEDQSLGAVALYPSESALVKMLYLSGFSHVWRWTNVPKHPHYRSNLVQKTARTILAASRMPLNLPALARVPEPACPWDMWTTTLGRAIEALRQVRRFAASPWPHKLATLGRRADRE